MSNISWNQSPVTSSSALTQEDSEATAMDQNQIKSGSGWGPSDSPKKVSENMWMSHELEE